MNRGVRNNVMDQKANITFVETLKTFRNLPPLAVFRYEFLSMAESFSGTHSGFNMTSGLPFAATNERRDLSTLSQMRLLIMEQQQNDVTVEASPEERKTKGLVGTAFWSNPFLGFAKCPCFNTNKSRKQRCGQPRDAGAGSSFYATMFAYVKPITVPSTKGLETVVVEEDE